MNVSIEIGFFAAAVGVLIGLFKLYKFFEKRAPSSIRSDVSTFNTKLGLLLLCIKDQKPSPSLHQRVTHILDRVFGKKLLSIRSVFMTALHSYLIIATTASVGYISSLFHKPQGDDDVDLATGVLLIFFMPIGIWKPWLPIAVCQSGGGEGVGTPPRRPFGTLWEHFALIQAKSRIQAS